MKRLAPLLLGGALTLAACADPASSPELPAATLTSTGIDLAVTTRDDDGEGSFRAAVAAANADPGVRHIRFQSGLGPIDLKSPVVFSGSQGLMIDGGGAVLDGGALPAGASAFVASGGGALELRRLTARRAPGPGITIALPATAAGTVEIVLREVGAIANGGHGILVNDQADYLTDPNSTSPLGSPASLAVRVYDSRFEANGFGAPDQDGLRVNEGGDGQLDARILRTIVTGNGGDGVELDERGLGDATFSVDQAVLDGNGGFDPADYDDGIDVDEAGDGHILGTIRNSSASRNFEQGVDLNENDAGDLRITMSNTTGSGNLEEGIEFEEDDDFAGGGDLVVWLDGIVTSGNGAADGDAGLKAREKGAGQLRGRIASVQASDNAIGGVLVREDAGGDLLVELVRVTAERNGGDGIKYDENGAGNLGATLLRGVVTANGGAGVAADQALAGTGALRLVGLVASGNLGGDLVPDAGVVFTQLP